MIKQFKQNDRVVFLGDSITHNNIYIEYIRCYYQKHFRNLNVRFFNSGIAGASISTGLRFYNTDLRKWNPTVVVMMYGMNDCGRDLLLLEDKEEAKKKLDAAYDAYQENLYKIVDKIKEDGYRLIICTPTPYDEINKSEEPFLPGCQVLLEKYAKTVREFASKHKIELIDYNCPLSLLLNERNDLMKVDHTHPNDNGHKEMARIFLKELGFNLDLTSLDEGYLENNRLTQVLRDLFAAEFLFLPETPNTIEKLEVAKSFKEKGERNQYYDYFCVLADHYIRYDGDIEKARTELEKNIELLATK